MKKLELFWNIVYYGIYSFDLFLRKLLGYLNPFALINNINRVKQFHSAHGIKDMNNFKNSVLNNRRTGISSIRSGGTMGGLLVLIEYGIFNIFQALFGKSIISELWQKNTNILICIIVFLGPVVVINNRLLFKNDRFLYYFKMFDKLEKDEKRNYFIISLISTVFIFSFFFLTFLLL